jgi:hypothetical protein
MEPGARRQLTEILALTAQLARGGFDHWLFGGWAVDFYLGKVTRPHTDIDVAVWLHDRPAIAELLKAAGWQHDPKQDEDGGTTYARNQERVELTFIAQGARGEVLIELNSGPAVWSHTPFGSEARSLAGVRCALIPLSVLRGGKSVPRETVAEAEIDRADFEALSTLRS